VSEGQWPAWATEPVELAAPDPRWPQQGERERRRVQRRLSGSLIGEVEHVGSTAVPGLPAKPIIDVQATVTALEPTGPIVALLAPNGWQLVPPELDGRSWERFVVQVSAGRRAAHLHLLAPGTPQGDERRRFRDALRGRPRAGRRLRRTQSRPGPGQPP